MENKTLFTVLSWLVFASLSLAIARQLSAQKIIDGSLYHEAFANYSDATLDKPRDSYALLNDYKKTKPTSETSSLTAESCYDKDFLAKTELTGNFIQRTNNFRHANPDSCTTPLTELVNTVYA